MNKPKQLRYLIPVLLLLGGSLFALFKKTPWAEVLRQIKDANALFILIAVFLMGLFFLCEALSLKQLFGHFQYKTPLRRTYGYALIDFYYSGITPGASGGQPAQIFYMSRDNIEPGIASVSLLCFNLSYHISALLIGLFGMIHSFDILKGHRIITLLLIYGLLAQLVLVVLFSALLIHEKIVKRFLQGLLGLLSHLHLVKRKTHWEEKINTQISEFKRASTALREKPTLLLKTVVLTTLHLILFYSIPYLMLRAFHFDVNYLDLLTLQACLQLAMESLPIPGGLGVTEASFLRLYGSLIGGEKIVSILLLSRMISYSLGLISGGILSLIMVASPRKLKRYPQGVRIEHVDEKF